MAIDNIARLRATEKRDCPDYRACFNETAQRGRGKVFVPCKTCQKYAVAPPLPPAKVPPPPKEKVPVMRSPVLQKSVGLRRSILEEMEYLIRKDGVAISTAVAKRLGVIPENLIYHLKKMEKEGLIILDRKGLGPTESTKLIFPTPAPTPAQEPIAQPGQPGEAPGAFQGEAEPIFVAGGKVRLPEAVAEGIRRKIDQEIMERKEEIPAMPVESVSKSTDRSIDPAFKDSSPGLIIVEHPCPRHPERGRHRDKNGKLLPFCLGCFQARGGTSKGRKLYFPGKEPAVSDSVNLIALLAKFPDFDSTWPAEVQLKWFEGFHQILELLKKNS